MSVLQKILKMESDEEEDDSSEDDEEYVLQSFWFLFIFSISWWPTEK